MEHEIRESNNFQIALRTSNNFLYEMHTCSGFIVWKRTHVNVVRFVFQNVYRKMECAKKDDGEHLRCRLVEKSGTPRRWWRSRSPFMITFSSIVLSMGRRSRCDIVLM